MQEIALGNPNNSLHSNLPVHIQEKFLNEKNKKKIERIKHLIKSYSFIS
jgi:hypothetical protein